MSESTPINLLRPQPLEPSLPPNPPPKKRYCFYFLVVALIVLLGNCGYRYFSLRNLPEDPTAYDLKTLKPKRTGFLNTVRDFIFSSSNALEGEQEDRINILLLGMGGAGHDGPYLTDTNIILSIRPVSREIALVSVPRDLGAKIDGAINKINYANALGEAKNPGQGGEAARTVFADTFNLDIPYYVRLDFRAFTEIVDAVGGVEVDVPRAFSDSQYPDSNDGYQTVTFLKGQELMNGDRAL